MSVSKHKMSQFPPPSGPYKVSPKNIVRWQRADTVRLQISVGKPVYEGDKFFALCEWAAQRFDHVELIVSDSLQRHNLMMSGAMDEAAAHRISNLDGEAWLLRNARAITQITTPEIIRWDTLIADPRFNLARVHLDYLYQIDASFSAALEGTIDAFWQRNTEAWATQQERLDARMHSRAFLLEELAVFTYLCAPAGLDVYAGSWLEAIFAALACHNTPMHAAFRKPWLQVDFTRNKGFKPNTTPAPQLVHQALSSAA